MASRSTDNALRFSTEALPERDRLDYFREVFARQCVRVDFEPIGDRPIRCDGILHALPNAALATVAATPHSGTRTPELVTDGRNDIGLFTALQGTVHVSHRGREVVLHEGDAVLLQVAEVSSLSCESNVRFRCLNIPEAVLAPMVHDTDSVPMTVVPAESQELRLLLNYIEAIQREGILAAHSTRHVVAMHIHDLVALAIGATRDAAAVAAGRGVRAARLQAIKTDVVTHLGRPDFSLDTVAARLGISPSYIRKLFGDEDTTFSKFVLGQRVSKAYRMLSDPRLVHLNVSAIAFECGFGDLSYFNRVFRRHYHASPSEVRAAAHGQ